MANLNQLPASEGQYERDQLKNLLEFFETGVNIYEDLEAQNPNSILKLLGTALRIKNKIS
jgi:hypothetical protein